MVLRLGDVGPVAWIRAPQLALLIEDGSIAHRAGSMFWLRRNTLSGSYFALISLSRASVDPYATDAARASSSPMKLEYAPPPRCGSSAAKVPRAQAISSSVAAGSRHWPAMLISQRASRWGKAVASLGTSRIAPPSERTSITDRREPTLAPRSIRDSIIA